MDFLLSRYRNLTALLLVILAQLVLLACQVKSNQDVRLIRVWAVTAVTPMARMLEFVRENTVGVAENYFVLVNTRSDNERLKGDLGRLKIENQFLKTELETADRVRALAAFQQRTPSRTLAARIIGTGTGANSRVVFIDRGSAAGVMRGMAVITPDGIVGKVLAAYPTASQVLLVTDQTFAAGVISGKNRIHGTLKGIGQNKVIVDYVQNEEKVEPGEMFYTSGDDRIFPKGMPAGKVSVVRQGRTFREIFLVPVGFQQGLEEVLVVTGGVNSEIPDQATATANPAMYMTPQAEPPKPGPAGPSGSTGPSGVTGVVNTDPTAISNLTTDADRLRQKYKTMGEQQGVKYGEGGKIPNFNADLPSAVKPPPQQAKPPVVQAKPPVQTPPPVPVPEPVKPEPVKPEPQP